MNPPVKKGKYSMVDDESIQSCSTHLQQQNNLKQCEYVSNRTRLRCQNVKSVDELKDFGFCNEHQGYIGRIRKEGLRTKHLFDPNFNISEGFLELISFDDDETLDSRVPTDFPFIYEPLYCESRLDGDENPLRNAGIFNKKEILSEYCRAIKRCQAAIREQRVIYREKHSKILRQGIRLAEQPNPVQIDPIKNVGKIQRLNVMRRDALRLDQRQVFNQKFARLDTDLAEKCVEKRNKWLQQIEIPIDEDERIVSQLVTEMVDLIVLTKSKRGPKTLLTPSAMHSIAKQNFVNSNSLNSSSLPNTLIDILKILKNSHFDEYERKIKKEEEEMEKQRLGRKIAIKMVNPQTMTSSTITNIGISRGSSISSDGQSTTPSLITNLSTTNLTQKINSTNNLISSKKSSFSSFDRQPIKRRFNENQIGYFSSTIQIQQSSTTSTTNPIKNLLSSKNNYLDPHGYLSSNNNFGTFLRPSTSSNGNLNNFKNNSNKIIRPISIDEDINPEVFLQLTHPQLTDKDNNNKIGIKRRQASVELIEDDINNNNNDLNTFVCARINLPWNGKRKTPFKKQLNKNQDSQQLNEEEKNTNNGMEGEVLLNRTDLIYPDDQGH
ncbi:hypothetical protein ACQ4LE_005725 [Meloidogyne hapla]